MRNRCAPSTTIPLQSSASTTHFIGSYISHTIRPSGQGSKSYVIRFWGSAQVQNLIRHLCILRIGSTTHIPQTESLTPQRQTHASAGCFLPGPPFFGTCCSANEQQAPLQPPRNQHVQMESSASSPLRRPAVLDPEGGSAEAALFLRSGRAPAVPPQGNVRPRRHASQPNGAGDMGVG